MADSFCGALQALGFPFTLLQLLLLLLLSITTDHSSQILTQLSELLFVVRTHKHVKPWSKENTVRCIGKSIPDHGRLFALEGRNSLEAE